MIIRVEHKRRFTVIADASLRDPRLSFRATGVLAFLLSLADGTDISGRRLCQTKKEGRDATLAALKELEEAGYLVRSRHQNPADGRWTTLCTVVEAATDNPPPSPGFQDSDIQDSENQDLKAFELPTANTKGFKAAGSQEPDARPWCVDCGTWPCRCPSAVTKDRSIEWVRALRRGEKPA